MACQYLMNHFVQRRRHTRTKSKPKAGIAAIKEILGGDEEFLRESLLGYLQEVPESERIDPCCAPPPSVPAGPRRSLTGAALVPGAVSAIRQTRTSFIPFSDSSYGQRPSPASIHVRMRLNRLPCLRLRYCRASLHFVFDRHPGARCLTISIMCTIYDT